MVGIRPRKRGEDFEGLRRRLEGENTNAAMATGSDGRLGGEVGRRRTLGRQLLDQFRGAFWMIEVRKCTKDAFSTKYHVQVEGWHVHGFC
jgi:hypothetical protein